MSDNYQQLQFDDDSDKSSIYFLGSIIGLIVGFIAAHLYARAAEELENKDGLKATDSVKIALTVLGLVRTITELGTGNKKSD